MVVFFQSHTASPQTTSWTEAMPLKGRSRAVEKVDELEKLMGFRTALHRVVQLSQLIWACAQGLQVSTVARHVRLATL
ncbi:MAG TPA: hypothetical protein VI542_03410 [Candidatus Tectomicrobia bacterium]